MLVISAASVTCETRPEVKVLRLCIIHGKQWVWDPFIYEFGLHRNDADPVEVRKGIPMVG